MRQRLLLGAIFALTAVAGALHFADAEPVAVFLAAAAALGGLAWAIGIGTESVGTHFGPAITGVLQSTLGNLPELFIVVFSLAAARSSSRRRRSSARCSQTRCSCSAWRSSPVPRVLQTA